MSPTILSFALVLQITPAAQPAPAAYWQQDVSYAIDATLDEAQGLLRGSQRVVYRNRSPDTLSTLSFHLHLNAFRPNSRWAQVDLAEQRRRFNDLRDPDFGMNQVRNVRIMGQPVTPIYPFAPDSTIVRFALPHFLLPGDSLVAELDWAARPSTLPRRQGRRGRAFDFAQWYPKVVVYDKHGWQEQPLLPSGEFYGEFGDFTVTLDLPEDQVVGATGVPMCGDPGWERANRHPSRAVEYQRDHYPSALAALTPNACAPKAPGRKTVVWRAEQVHHFALSMRPDYRYEGGRAGPVAVHVLYQPGDEATWGGGVVVKRTQDVMAWLGRTFGTYPWPQMTNVHRLEGGGTEFPMMMHNGNPSLGLILHEAGHNYVMGILANNEWREGFLDEGFTSYQTTRYFLEQGDSARYRAAEARILGLDLEGRSEPVSYPSHDYRDFATYTAMIYTRGELFFHRLHALVGADAMAQILRTYYDRWQLKHVDEDAFRQVAEQVSGRDLSTFFAQWLHGNVRYDYAIRKVRSSRVVDGRWITRVEVERREDGVLPVDVVVRTPTDQASARIDGYATRETVTLLTQGRPHEVVLDPDGATHDWNMLNNRQRRSLLGWRNAPSTAVSIDRLVTTPVYRDRRAVAVLPTVWYNDAGGVMAGFQLRSNYFGRFNQLTFRHSVATRLCCEGGEAFNQWQLRYQNPIGLYAPRLATAFEAFSLEGRRGAAVLVEKERLGHLGFGPRDWYGLAARWVATSDLAFLDQALYENAGTIEATAHWRTERRVGAVGLRGRVDLTGGLEYRNRDEGTATSDRYDAQPYARLSLDAAFRRPIGGRSELGLRVFGGVVASETDPVRQRWFYLAGADPYQQLGNPFTRSRDALLTGDVHWH
ncbi:MAG: M1 family metallopeptidase, partial [Gemmatimonadales bacterium]